MCAPTHGLRPCSLVHLFFRLLNSSTCEKFCWGWPVPDFCITIIPGFFHQNNGLYGAKLPELDVAPTAFQHATSDSAVVKYFNPTMYMALINWSQLKRVCVESAIRLGREASL